MATKQLSYNTNAIDDRLGKAHSHSNLHQLEILTDEDFNNIEEIKNKLNINMSNVDLADLAKAVKLSGVAFEDAESNGYTFARKDGKWVNITSNLKSVIGKGDSNIDVTNDVTEAGNVITVTLSADVVKKLNSISTKLDAIVNPVANNIVSVKADGTIQDSGIGKSDVILKSELENNYLSQAKNTSPSSYALYEVYKIALGISGGVGQIRGTVYNAFTSSNCAVIDTNRAISVLDPGENYAEGSIVYSSVGSIPAVFKIVEVESGSNGIKTLEVVSSGNFEINPSSDEVSFSVYGNVGSGAQIKCYLDNSAVYSTLDTIENPTNRDLAIVMKDEYHNSSSSIYMYVNIEDSTDSFNGWVWLASFSDANRNFELNPIGTEEIQDNSITSDKLYKIPEKSLLANNSDSPASPVSMTFSELSNLLGVIGNVTGVKGSAETEYRKGNVEISLQNISGALGIDSITVNPQYLSKTVSSDGSQIILDLTDEVKSLGDWDSLTGKPDSFNPSSHADTSTTYGAASDTNYGHTRLANNLTTDSSGGYSLDAYQGKILNDKIGDLSSLQTSTNDNLVDAVNECFQNASDGKTAVVNALLAKGVTGITSDSSWQQIATAISDLSSLDNSVIGYNLAWANALDSSKAQTSLYCTFSDFTYTRAPGLGSGDRVWTPSLWHRSSSNRFYFFGVQSAYGDYNGGYAAIACDEEGNYISEESWGTSVGAARTSVGANFITQDGEFICSPDSTKYIDANYREHIYIIGSKCGSVEITNKPSGVSATGSAIMKNIWTTGTTTTDISNVYSILTWDPKDGSYLYKGNSCIEKHSSYNYVEGHATRDIWVGVSGTTMDIYNGTTLSKTVTLEYSPNTYMYSNPVQINGDIILIFNSNLAQVYDLDGNFLGHSGDYTYLDEYDNYYYAQRIVHKWTTELFTHYNKVDDKTTYNTSISSCGYLKKHGGRFITVPKVGSGDTPIICSAKYGIPLVSLDSLTET